MKMSRWLYIDQSQPTARESDDNRAIQSEEEEKERKRKRKGNILRRGYLFSAN